MEKRPFLIDCDTGTDDAIAIMAALYSPQIDIQAITSVNGNVAEVYTSRNNLDLMEYLGKDIPVARGAVRALQGGGINAEGGAECHGEKGLGTIQLPTAQRAFDPRVADQVIYDTAVKCKGELELLVIGRIWFMGGAALGGNVLPTAEFNIWADALAAHIVTQSGIPMTMVGLDVTLKAVMTEEDIALLRQAGTKAANLTADLLDFMVVRRDEGGEDLVMHDALALAAALCPECLVCKDCFIDVEFSHPYTMGYTFVDQGGRTGKAPNAAVALDIDVPMFRRWLVEAISRSALEK